MSGSHLSAKIPALRLNEGKAVKSDAVSSSCFAMFRLMTPPSPDGVKQAPTAVVLLPVSWFRAGPHDSVCPKRARCLNSERGDWSEQTSETSHL